MSHSLLTRRTLMAASGASLATFAPGLSSFALASVAPTPSMRGGSNNYLAGAPIVERIGDGMPLAGQRIQIWAHTTEGHERDPHSHGATLTDEKGVFRLEMPQIVPAFGQAHGHLAYDSGEFETVFLRPVMPRASDTSLEAHFVLKPV